MKKVLAIALLCFIAGCGESAQERQDKINDSACTYAELLEFEHTNPSSCE